MAQVSGGQHRKLLVIDKQDTLAGAHAALIRSLAVFYRYPVKVFRPHSTKLPIFHHVKDFYSKTTHTKRVSLFTATRFLYEEKGVSGIVRLVIPPILANVIVGFSIFETFTISSQTLPVYFPSFNTSPHLLNFLSGSLAGVSQATISTPFSFAYSTKNLTGLHNQLWTIWKEKGFLGLYKGFLSNVVRDSIGLGVFFSSYLAYKNYYSQFEIFEKMGLGDLPIILVSGASSGASYQLLHHFFSAPKSCI
eukprot:TRINITY_DN3768_c0_g1_i1.p1 TRINITY_DN3768_c0_g1~~TRINITY_DN3768_c0_g1_i1.p1  ORF type:complete len:249 (+),score=31.28 TRINITY_DN3768_c0_g1_i1:63-809(+)